MSFRRWRGRDTPAWPLDDVVAYALRSFTSSRTLVFSLVLSLFSISPFFFSFLSSPYFYPYVFFLFFLPTFLSLFTTQYSFFFSILAPYFLIFYSSLVFVFLFAPCCLIPFRPQFSYRPEKTSAFTHSLAGGGGGGGGRSGEEGGAEGKKGRA